MNEAIDDVKFDDVQLVQNLFSRTPAAAHCLRDATEGDLATLDARLRECHAVGSAAWPGIALSPEAFVEALAPHVEAEWPIVPADFHTADFFLAAACVHGAPGAVVALERAFLARIPDYIARVCRPSDRERPEDVAQSIAERLVVPTGAGPARIAEYSGRGALGGWLRVLAVRVALNTQRGKSRFTSLEGRPDRYDAPTGVDPELDLFRMKYRADFKCALEAAFFSLDTEQRALLRLFAAGSQRGEDLGKVLGVDRSTATRRLARARAHLFAFTKRALTTKLGISTGEFDSIARVVHSRIELTLSRVLAAQA